MAFWRLFYHLVWSTKNREPLIQPAIEDLLYAYLVKKAVEQEAYVYAINGWYDHVHLVIAIPPKYAVAEVVKRMKGASAHYLNHEIRLGSHFAWQRGYGALSVGERQRAIAEAYVANQKQHHAQQTTNRWLESVDEMDEGPLERGMKPESPSSAIHEDRAEYVPWDDIPF